MVVHTLLFGLTAVLAASAGGRPGDWTGDYSPCDQHAAVLKPGAMSLGVRFSTSNRVLAAQFARALDFWAAVVEMDWHVEYGRECAIQIVDGQRGLFKPGEAARAQFPAMPSFQGWIAFNPRHSMSADELFLAAVHELGHLLGLPHNSNPSSVMYFLRLDGPALLDSADLALLAALHNVRREVSSCPSQRVGIFRSPAGCGTISRTGSGSTSLPG